MQIEEGLELGLGIARSGDHEVTVRIDRADDALIEFRVGKVVSARLPTGAPVMQALQRGV